jgi:membrane associated rhomboid family serine protease
MKCQYLLIALILTTCLLCGTSGQDPLYSVKRNVAQVRNQFRRNLLASTPPYRKSSPPAYRGEDYSRRVLDWDEWRYDKRCRTYQVNPRQRTPGRLSWTSRIAWATIITFFVQTIQPSITALGYKLSDRILRGEQLYRLVTPVFLHGGVAHLFTNMYSLNNVGRDVEVLFGPGRFLATYLVAGATGNLLSSFRSPNPSLGASGAVFGIVGAYYVFLNRNEWFLGGHADSITNSITQTIALNVVLGFMNPVIDNWGHIGGALGGALMAYCFGPRLYLAKLPMGGNTLVDRPICRLPPNIESLPKKIEKRIDRMTRRMQIMIHQSDLSPRPWQRQNTPPRRPLPNRSIKPNDF